MTWVLKFLQTDLVLFDIFERFGSYETAEIPSLNFLNDSYFNLFSLCSALLVIDYFYGF